MFGLVWAFCLGVFLIMVGSVVWVVSLGTSIDGCLVRLWFRCITDNGWVLSGGFSLPNGWQNKVATLENQQCICCSQVHLMFLIKKKLSLSSQNRTFIG